MKKRKPSKQAPECLITIKNWGGIKEQTFKGVPTTVEIDSPWEVHSLLGERMAYEVTPHTSTTVKVVFTRGTESAQRQTYDIT